MNSSSDSEDRCETPLEILKDAQEVIDSHLPERSKGIYNKEYEQFMRWKSEINASSLSENVLLSYFSQKAKKYKPNTLWSIYSMLKSTLLARNNVNIKGYTKLKGFLRKQAEGYKSKKSKVFSATEIDDFLRKAPDDKYLALKVVLILGVNGACRCNELINLAITDFETHGNMYLVKLPATKSKKLRSFVIGEIFYDIVKKYIELRPGDVDTKRFLLQYRNSKCTKQVMGKNRISTIPQEIALFLNLPNPQEYTGHCFRRTSATLLAHSGAVLTTIKQNDGGMPTMVEKANLQNFKDDAAESSDEEVQEIDDLVYYCSNCKCRIFGVRYKCVQCEDYEMCAACEARGVHALHYALRVPEHSVQDEVHRIMEAIRKCLYDYPYHIMNTTSKNESDQVPEEIEILPDIKVEMETSPEDEVIKEEFEAAEESMLDVEDVEESDPLSARLEQRVPQTRGRADTVNTSTTRQALTAPTLNTVPKQHTTPTQQTHTATTNYLQISSEKHEGLAATHHSDTVFAHYTHNIPASSASQTECSSCKTRNLISKHPAKKRKTLSQIKKRLKNKEKKLNPTGKLKLLDQRLLITERTQHSRVPSLKIKYNLAK